MLFIKVNQSEEIPMSKFLKFIVHFAVICTIVCVLGLALPPFFGVRTVIMDSTDKATNLPLGSVTYAIPVRTEEVTAGSPILVQEDFPYSAETQWIVPLTFLPSGLLPPFDAGSYVQ